MKRNLKRSENKKNVKFNLKLYFSILGISLAVILSAFFIAAVCGVFNSNAPIPEENGEITEDLLEPVDKASGKVNALLLGVDNEGLRTDTIIIVSYDLDNDKINVLSVPRDTRMYVGRSYQKINAAHAISQNGKIKGPQGTIEAVTRLTGIPINYYIEFSFATFRNTIDVLGGVYFDVPRNMNYSDPVQNLYINLKKGYQLLDGDKAEQLVRFRRYPEGDIARVQMQQAFLTALCEQKLNASMIKKLPDLFKQLSEDINTNIKLVDVMKYLPNLADFSTENITMYQLPGNYNDTDYGASYWICNIAKTKELVEGTFGYDASKITIHSADGSSKSKDVKKSSTPVPTSAVKSDNTEDTAKETAKPTTKPVSSPTPTAEAVSTSNSTADSNTTAKPEIADKNNDTAKETAKPSKTAAPDTTDDTETTAKPQLKETPKPVSTLKPITTPVLVHTPAPVQPENTSNDTDTSSEQ